jgi:hypothetical protein
VFPGRRGGLDPHGGEEANAALAVENAGKRGLADTDGAGELGPREAQALEPTTQTPKRSTTTPPTQNHGTDINMTVAQVNVFRATDHPVAKVPTSEDVRASRRYRALVEELIREYAERNDTKKTQRAREHGAISHIAAELGLKQSSLSKIQSEDRNAGSSVIRAAMKRLRIREEYFYGVKEPSSYRDYVPHGKEPIFSGWKEFLGRDSGQSMTPKEREIVALAPVPDGWEPTWQFYEAQLFAQRSLLTRAEVGRVIKKSNEIAEEARGRKRTPQKVSEDQ